MIDRRYFRTVVAIFIPMLWILGSLWMTDIGRTVSIGAPVDVGFEIMKTAWPDPVTSGNLVTYTITVHNTGDIGITGMTITDTVPTSSVVAGVGNNGELVNGQVQWLDQVIGAGESLSVTFTVAVTGFAEDGGLLINSDYAASAEGAVVSGSIITTTVNAQESPTATPTEDTTPVVTLTPTSTTTETPTPTVTVSVTLPMSPTPTPYSDGHAYAHADYSGRSNSDGVKY